MPNILKFHNSGIAEQVSLHINLGHNLCRISSCSTIVAELLKFHQKNIYFSSAEHYKLHFLMKMQHWTDYSELLQLLTRDKRTVQTPTLYSDVTLNMSYRQIFNLMKMQHCNYNQGSIVWKSVFLENLSKDPQKMK